MRRFFIFRLAHFGCRLAHLAHLVCQGFEPSIDRVELFGLHNHHLIQILDRLLQMGDDRLQPYQPVGL